MRSIRKPTNLYVSRQQFGGSRLYKLEEELNEKLGEVAEQLIRVHKAAAKREEKEHIDLKDHFSEAI